LVISWIAGGATYGVLALGFFLAFLGYRPALVGLKDLLKQKRYPRTFPSFAAGAVLLLAGVTLMVLTRKWPLLVCLAGFGGVFAAFDMRGEKRGVLRESFGALLAVPAACFVTPAASGVLILRPIVSVLSVRGLIARWDDAKLCRWLAVWLGAGLIPISWFAFGSFDWRFAAYCVCFLRPLISALSAGKNVKPIQIGINEMAVSLIVLLGLLLDRLVLTR
jgi:hypothetical protein